MPVYPIFAMADRSKGSHIVQATPAQPKDVDVNEIVVRLLATQV